MDLSNVAILFDMDGTLGDFYNVPNWLEEVRSFSTHPYEVAKPMWDTYKLSHLLSKCIERGAIIKIVSWCSKESNKRFDDRTRTAKLKWLRDNHIPYTSYRITHYGYPKEYCRIKCRRNILVDDNREIRKNFRKFENCETINPQKVDLIEWLEKLLAD